MTPIGRSCGFGAWFAATFEYTSAKTKITAASKAARNLRPSGVRRVTGVFTGCRPGISSWRSCDGRVLRAARWRKPKEAGKATGHPPVPVAHDRDKRGDEEGADDHRVDQ